MTGQTKPDRQHSRRVREPRKPLDAAHTATELPTDQSKPFVFDPDRIMKYLALIGVVAYVSGILITNIYLLRFGVTEFSFLKPRFIYTGLLALFIISLPILCWMFAYLLAYIGLRPLRLLGVRYQGTPIFITFSIVLGIPIYTTSLDALLYPITGEYFTPKSLEEIHFESIISLLNLWYIGMFIGIASYLYTRGYLDTTRIFRYTRGSITEFLLQASVLMLPIMFIFGISLFFRFFALDIYPLVPEQFGGGKPSQAKLLFLNEGEAKSARFLGLVITPDSLLSDTVELIFEGDDTYVIRLPDGQNGKIAQIQKKLVSGVLTDSPGSVGTSSPTPQVTSSPSPQAVGTPSPQPTDGPRP